MRRFLLALFAATALVAAGCGDDDNDSGGTPGAESAGTAVADQINEDAKKGGSITFLSAGDVDFMDPGQTYYAFAFMVHYATNRTLYGFEPDDSQNAVPDLADGEPQVSEDNKTITVKIKPGIKYSPPVDRDVTSADVKYAIERSFTTSVPSGYATSYFSDIIGAPDEPVKIADLKPFEGLETPDDQTLVIKLEKASAPQVVAALVMPITIPVPKEFAEKFDAKVPSDYNQYVAFTGPYMVKNDPETGELIGWDQGKKMEIVRNPNWNPETDYRPAYLDSVTIEMGNSDETVANRRILNGQNLMGMDSSGPPAAILRELLTRRQDQYGRVPSGGAHWDSFNTTKPPLDNVNIRRAIIANVDKDAIRAVGGGEATGPIARSYIPPGIPGHEESGGVEGFTEFDWMTCDTGCPDIAEKYMQAAADDGAPVENGKYTGNDTIEMMTNNTPDGLKGAEVAAQDIRELGFDVDIKQVPTDTLYSKFCGVPKQSPHMCVGIGWLKDFQDAQSMLQPTFHGDSIKPAGNVNWSLLDDPAINKAMDDASTLPIGDERNQAFAEVNRMIVEQAPALLTTWDDNFQQQSENVAGVMNGYTTAWDLSFSSIK